MAEDLSVVCCSGCIHGVSCMFLSLNFPWARSNSNWQPTRKLIWLMILGSRMEAISILGREVMEPRGLVGLGKDSLDFCGAEIAQVCCSISRYLLNFPAWLITHPDPRSLHRPLQLSHPRPLHPRQRSYWPSHRSLALPTWHPNRCHRTRLPDVRRRTPTRERVQNGRDLKHRTNRRVRQLSCGLDRENRWSFEREVCWSANVPATDRHKARRWGPASEHDQGMIWERPRVE